MTILLQFLFLILLGSPTAQASAAWYAKPQTNVRALLVNDQTVIQGTAGIETGYRYGLSDSFKGRTRAGLLGIYGFNTGSAGADLRLGSFVGPVGKSGFVMTGPDFWLNGYGSTSSSDYQLPWSTGISIPTTASLTISPAFRLVGAVTPGWAFQSNRRLGGVGPFDELTLLGAGVISTGSAYLTLGYQHSWNNVGVIRGVILSGAL